MPHADIGPDTRRAVDLVAIESTGEIKVVRAALGLLGNDPDALVDAERLGMLRMDEGRVEFVDPDWRSAVVIAVAPSEARVLHRALADALAEPRHRIERAEHLALAAAGPDREAADALAGLGAEEAAGGDPARAGEYFTRAGALADDAEHRAMHLYHAADAYWNAADYNAARAAFDAAHIGSQEPILRADIAWQLGQLDLYERGPQFARDLFVSAAHAVEPFDVDRAAILLVNAASTVTLSSDVVGALVLARQASELADRGNDASRIAASLMFAFVSLQHGDIDEFDERFPPLLELAHQLKDADLPELDTFLQLVGMMHVFTERWETGRVFLTALAHTANRRARTATAALATAVLGELCWRSGRWEEAWTLATGELVTGVSLTGARLWLLAFTAHLDAGFGRADDCRRRAHAAIAESEQMGFGTVIIWAYHGLGLLELGLGHAVAAASHLDRVSTLAGAHEIVDPSVVWWQADHVEALVRSGRPHEATQALARFESGAALTGTAWGAATSARCRALMATTTEDAERWFEQAMTHHARLTAPFELARTLLCRAERRVAMNSPLDPAGDLVEAIAIFDSLGATAWSAQGCALRDTINSVGESNGDDLLSPAERRVAEAVVAGMTNREVAVSLYVSEKTVEFHLHNIFRKLDVRSRTQLVRRLSST